MLMLAITGKSAFSTSGELLVLNQSYLACITNLVLFYAALNALHTLAGRPNPPPPHTYFITKFTHAKIFQEVNLFHLLYTGKQLKNFRDWRRQD